MRILVVIANYGLKNTVYVERLFKEYRSMSYDVDVVVLSNIPKEFGSDIEVSVGLPAKDPWSLPFKHKKIFAERIDEYDLFIYSEDDTLVKQENIEAFLKVTRVLPEDELAGFLRYEEDTRGKKYCSTAHSHYHWVPSSVKAIREYVFAQFTNAHSASYILTREQLKKALASGGYLVPPHKGYYDLLCTAATDPYTQCGFRKMICISHIDDFLLHHLPNQYIGKLGLELSEMHAQINALLAINGDEKAQVELLPKRVDLHKSKWDKQYYEQCRNDILTEVCEHSKTVLSVGCGWGATEARLVQKGVRVVGMPLDTIIAESAKSRGIEVISPDFDRASKALKNEKFACILFVDVLHYMSNPAKILAEYAKLLDKGGCMIISVPNYRYIRYFYESVTNRKVFKTTSTYLTTTKQVAGWITQSGLNIIDLKYSKHDRFGWIQEVTLGLLSKFFSPKILFTAEK